MYLWEWFDKISDKEQRRKELTALANQPSKLEVVLQVAQNWLDRRWPNCRISEILELDYEWKFRKWLTLEVVDKWNTPWIFEK